MKIIEEFRFALTDGLGKKEAKKYEVFPWKTEWPSAIAVQLDPGSNGDAGNRTLYLLVDGTDLKGGPRENGQQSLLSSEKYLELARKISVEYSAFVVPDQSLTGWLLWGGKTRGPICVYRFRVIDAPVLGFGSNALPPNSIKNVR